MISDMVSYYQYEGLKQVQPWAAPSQMLRNAATTVNEKINEISQASSFLSSAPQHTNVPLFDRGEIHVGKFLGSGGFSQVHLVSSIYLRCDDNDIRKRGLAEQAYEGRAQYALKHLRPELIESSDDFESAAIDLCVEVAFLTRLDHPNIIRVRGLARGDTNAFSCGHDGYFIIMDRLEPLDARIHRWRDRHCHFPDYRPVSLARKLNYASQIADALRYLHERRIIFRDLKPANVGFNIDDTCQIFDFGLCRELPKEKSGTEETFLMSGVGTRRFMAPEIVNTNCYNEKVDVYAWAMTVLEMITFEKPFPHYSSEQHAEHVCRRGERPFLSPYDVPKLLINLLEGAWAQDVRRRLSITAVCQKLDPLLERSDSELFQMSVNLPNGPLCATSLERKQPSVCKETTNVYFDFPPQFQQLLQDCEILSECSEVESCMDLTLTTTASTTWQDSVSTFAF